MTGPDCVKRIELELDLYEAFGVGLPTTSFGSTPHDDGKRAKIAKIHQYFEESYPNATTKQRAIQAVREKWTAGLGPVESWLMWMAIRFLARQVVSWLWERYNK